MISTKKKDLCMENNTRSQIALSIEQMLELRTLGLDISDTRLAWCPLVIHIYGSTPVAYYLMDKVVAESEVHGTIWPTYTLEDIIQKLPFAEIKYNKIMSKGNKWIASIYILGCKEIRFLANTPLEVAFNALKCMAMEHPDKIINLQTK